MTQNQSLLRMTAPRLLTICGLSLLALAALAPMPASAQQKADVPPPPRLEKLEEGEAPAVTIPERQGDKAITEKRDNGRVTSIKVQSGGSTYYLMPNDPKGSALPGDAQSIGTRPAQWQVLEFNTEPAKDKKPDTRPASAPAAPAAAPATPTTAPR